jgi:hypothetical protein
LEAFLKPNFLRSIVLSLLGIFCLASLTASAQTSLVISQVYGGGGNSGATYKNDFVELYNPTASAISTSGYSVQYASATGSSWQVTTLTAATIQPGHYYLVQEAAGAGGTTALPTADTTGSINMSATVGKVALVASTTALTGACPSASAVDFVGFGTNPTSGANCYLGSAAAATLTNTTADIRTGYAGNNSTDFVVGAPNPRNSSYGGSTTSLSATGLSTPSTVTSGNPVLLTVTVIPASSPASTGIAVTANLTAIGGSATQSFYDNGSNGDTTAGDNIFSFAVSPTVSASGTLSLPVTVTDAQSNRATTNISLTVNVPAVNLPIHTIQGSRSLTATSVSPYAGQTVTTQGIVTGIGTAGFFIQTPDADADSDPSTPEGIYVYSGSGKVPATAVIGNYVQVTGVISIYPAVTASHTPASELSTTAATILSTGQQLPTPVVISSSKLTPSGGLYQLTPYEGMRVSIPSLTTISGTGGSLTSEATETQKSSGQFFAVLTGTPRPFREPGIDIRDAQTGLPANVAQFDDNPERILVDSVFLGGTAIDLSTGAVLPSVTGILDFTYSSDSYYDPSRLLLDSAYNRSAVVAGATVQPVPDAASNEFRVAAYNIERFFNPNSADDIDYNPVTGKTEKSSAVDVTAAAYANRLTKLSLAIRHVLGDPDVIALEEPENQSVVADIAAKISADAQAAGEADPQYAAYGTGTGYAPYTNDVGGISVGFLVKSTVDTINIQQLGANDLFTDPRDGSTQQTLNDRPPLVLHAGVKRSGATDYPVTVIVNHLRSLSSENDAATGVFVRAKKELQAEYLARLIQDYQLSGEHVISVGDYNAFEFSDGYIDILGTVTNRNLLSSTQVVEQGMAGLVIPPATDLALLLPADQRWSYQEYGNAQILDHIVATADLVAAGAHMTYAHLNADQPVIDYNDPTTPARTSDHDAAVGYFTLPAPVLSATLSGSGSFGSVTLGSSSSSIDFVLTNTGEGAISITNVAATGDFSQTNNCGSSLALGATCTVSVTFLPTATGLSSGSLSVTTNTGVGVYSVSLNGTGTPRNVSSSVSITASGLIYNRIAKTATTTVKVANTSGTTISGPLELVLAISNSAATAQNASGVFNGNPYWKTAGSLAPGASVSFTVTFNCALGASFSTTPSLYQGGF